ncbi:MAG: hypothetical protein ACYSSN_10920 [Planctomycetota bacterium]
MKVMPPSMTEYADDTWDGEIMILYSSALALFGNGSPIDGWTAWIRVGNSNKDIRKSLFICKGS